jgi:hypothetical protein
VFAAEWSIQFAAQMHRGSDATSPWNSLYFVDAPHPIRILFFLATTRTGRVSFPRIHHALVRRRLVIFSCFHQIFHNTLAVLKSYYVIVLAKSISLILRHLVIFSWFHQIFQNTQNLFKAHSVAGLAKRIALIGAQSAALIGAAAMPERGLERIGNPELIS